MGIIFDLDQTIVDSSIALEVRKSRIWPNVYELIPSFSVYEGMLELIEELNNKKIPMCIVTSSPSAYCDKVLRHHKIPITQKVCYHDTQYRKPYPHPILKAISLLNVTNDQIISIGDDPNDIIASKKAGVMSIGATWGTLVPIELGTANADHMVNTVAELKNLIYKKYDL